MLLIHIFETQPYAHMENSTLSNNQSIISEAFHNSNILTQKPQHHSRIAPQK